MLSNKEAASLSKRCRDGGRQIAAAVKRLWLFMGPQALITARLGFTTSGGNSLMDEEVDVSHALALLWYVPRSLMVALLAPFPSQWFDVSGSTGVMRFCAGAEMLLIYALLPSLLAGIGFIAARRQPEGLFLLIFAVVLTVTQALVIANVGILFRLRLLFLFPLLIMASGAGLLSPYRRIMRQASRFRRPRHVRHLRSGGV